MSTKGMQGLAHNEGIIGNVRAKNIAVGRGAKAMFTEGDRTVVQGHLQDLERAVAALPVTPAARAQLEGDVSKLKDATTASEPDQAKVSGILQTISGKLKMLGDATKGVVEVVQPLVKIAGFFHLSAGVLGLL
jgi:hypothetical protein